MKTFAAHQWIFLGISAVLAIAILPLPRPMYTALNLFVALAGGLLIWVAWKAKRFLWVVPGIAALLLYLPVLNQPFYKSTWIALDLIFIAVFVTAALTLKGNYLEGGES